MENVMYVELKLSQITIQAENMQENYPFLISAIRSYPPIHIAPKRRKPRRKRVRVASLIDGIIDAIHIDDL